MDRSLSQSLFEKAQQSIPGGVNSPVRAFSAVETTPVFASRGEGPYVFDVNDNRYIDFLSSWGAIILGHAHQDVGDAINKAVKNGTGFGLSTRVECELAELIKTAFSSIEMFRMVNSGTEAVMSAVRLARGFTGRNKIIMFEGCYHGHSDGFLAKAGSGLATFGIPASAGVPPSFTAETLLAYFNDLESVETICKEHGDDIACILVEPVAGNMGVIPPSEGFLKGLREICDRIGALLVLDEVITGFRIAWGGAQEKFNVQADITTLGKIIGGGLPVGGFGGRREIMEKLAPLGSVYQAGTLSGNPVVVSAGLTVLNILKEQDPYEELDRKGREFEQSMKAAAEKAGIPLFVGRMTAMLTGFFTEEPVTDYASAMKADARLYGQVFREMLEKGILTAPSQWEAMFIGLSHTEEVLSEAAEVYTSVLGNI